MCTSATDVSKTVSDNTITVIPVNGTPPGDKTHANGLGTAKSQRANRSIKMGNQQGSENGKSKKKGQKKTSRKSPDVSENKPQKTKTDKGSDRNKSISPKAEDIVEKSETMGKTADMIPSNLTLMEASATSDIFCEAVEAIGDRSPSSLEITRKVPESSSGDNTSFQSMTFATPLSTPRVQRANTSTTSAGDRVDELGKSIQRTIIERFSQAQVEQELQPTEPCDNSNGSTGNNKATLLDKPKEKTDNMGAKSEAMGTVDKQVADESNKMPLPLATETTVQNEITMHNTNDDINYMKATEHPSSSCDGIVPERERGADAFTGKHENIECSNISNEQYSSIDVVKDDCTSQNEVNEIQQAVNRDNSVKQPNDVNTGDEKTIQDYSNTTASGIGDVCESEEVCTYRTEDRETEDVQITKTVIPGTLSEEQMEVESPIARNTDPYNSSSSDSQPEDCLIEKYDMESLFIAETNVSGTVVESEVTTTPQYPTNIQNTTNVHQNNSRATDIKSGKPSGKWEPSSSDPIMDNLLKLIKQTLESDDTDFQYQPTDSDAGENLPEKQVNKKPEYLYSDREEDEGTLKALDMNEFQRLKFDSLNTPETEQIGITDDDTLTPDDMAEFDRLKKQMHTSETNNQAGNYVSGYASLDRFDLSSGETTEDSVIERPFQKVPDLSVTQEENMRDNQQTNNVESSTGENSEDPSRSQADDDDDQVFNDNVRPVKQRSLTEDEIRREIRKFMIPEMREALPKTEKLNQMLNDLHDITPTSEQYPDLDDREDSPECGNSSGLRSRTSVTSSELDISEHRDDVSTDSMYADDEDDSSSEVLFCKTYTEPERGTEVLVSCTVVNSSLKQKTCSSDEFWAENSACEDAYQQVEFAAEAVNKHYTNARSQMQDIQHHLQSLRHQMQEMEKQVVKTSLPSTDEFDFDHPERRAITD